MNEYEGTWRVIREAQVDMRVVNLVSQREVCDEKMEWDPKGVGLDLPSQFWGRWDRLNLCSLDGSWGMESVVDKSGNSHVDG